MPAIVYPQTNLTPVLNAIAQGGGGAAALPPGYMAAYLPDAIPAGWIPLDNSQSPVIADNPVLYALFGDRYNNPVDELTTRAQAASLIPAMTADNAPAGYVSSASTVYAAGYEAYRAFDGTTGSDSASNWITASGVMNGQLKIVLPAAQGLTKYAIVSRAGTGAEPKDFTLEGSTDGGSTWMVLDKRTGEVGWGDAGSSRTYELDASKLDGEYNAFRLNVTASDGSTYLAISQLILYGGHPVISQTPSGAFGLPNLKSSPAGFTGGVWCVKAG